jgi:hypothetical protein
MTHGTPCRKDNGAFRLSLLLTTWLGRVGDVCIKLLHGFAKTSVEAPSPVRLSHNMLYVDGEFKLAYPLVNSTAAIYTLESGAALAPMMFLV